MSNNRPVMRLNQLFFKYGVYLPIVLVRGERLGVHIKDMTDSQWWERGKIQALQNRKLKYLLKNVKNDVPYYENTLGISDVSENEARSILERLPFLTKDFLRDRSDELRSKAPRAPVTMKTTGGSTGRAVTVAKDRNATGREMAAQWRGWSWAGIDIGDKQARFWGVPISFGARLRARVIDAVGNRVRCSAFAVGEKDLIRYGHALNRFRPDYLYGYVSMMLEFAEFLRDSGFPVTFRPKAIITTAEVLVEEHRETLQGFFGCTVYNEYGCGELGTIAHECPERRMHVNAENMIIEVYSGERACEPGEPGELVITELNNRAMPLIRYRLGDFGVMDNAPCPCGRGLPVLKDIYGRQYDLVYNREGKRFHGEFFMYIFEEVKRRGLGVRGFQIVQKDWDRFVVKIQPDSRFGSEGERFIREQIRSGYGDYTRVEFERVERIEREKSGKLRLIKGIGVREEVNRVLE